MNQFNFILDQVTKINRRLQNVEDYSKSTKNHIEMIKNSFGRSVELDELQQQVIIDIKKKVDDLDDHHCKKKHHKGAHYDGPPVICSQHTIDDVYKLQCETYKKICTIDNRLNLIDSRMAQMASSIAYLSNQVNGLNQRVIQTESDIQYIYDNGNVLFCGNSNCSGGGNVSITDISTAFVFEPKYNMVTEQNANVVSHNTSAYIIGQNVIHLYFDVIFNAIPTEVIELYNPLPIGYANNNIETSSVIYYELYPTITTATQGQEAGLIISYGRALIKQGKIFFQLATYENYYVYRIRGQVHYDL